MTARTIVLSVLLGGASGVLATAVTSNHLSDYALQLAELTRPLRITEDRPKAFPNSYGEAVGRFAETSLRSVVTVYPKSPKGTEGYVREEALGSGIVVTSDGWIAVRETTPIVFEQSVIGIKDQLYPVVSVMRDTLTHVAFVKVQANSLPVVEFGNAFDTVLGQQIFIANSDSSIATASVVKQAWPQGFIVSTDVPSRRFVLDQIGLVNGSPAFDLSGALVGFVDATQTASSLVPIEIVLPALSSLLEKKQIMRPSLGVLYVDIAHSVGFAETKKRGFITGAYVVGRPVPKKGTPAAIAGLLEGDIILSVNGQNVNEKHGLDELISTRKAHEEVTIVYDRAGEKKTVKVVLGVFVK